MNESAETFIERVYTTLARIRLGELVTFELSETAQPQVIALDLVETADRGKGYARCAMKALLSIADDLEFDIVTIPQAREADIDQGRLIKWLTRAGFEAEADGKTWRRKVLWSSNYKKA
jgi:hypothetical protein